MKQLLTKLYRKCKTIVSPEPTYPCKECFLVLGGAGCKDVCDKIELDKNKLLEHVTKYNNCPDCGNNKFYRGPSGGMSVNIKCGACQHKFNSGLPMVFERIAI